MAKRNFVTLEPIKQIKDEMDAESERTGYGISTTWQIAAIEFIKRHGKMSPDLARKFKEFFKSLK